MNKKNILTVIIFLFFHHTALANIDGARTYVHNTAENIFNILQQQKETLLIREELIKYIKEQTDIAWISKFVLGKNWHNTTSSQRENFIKLFEQYLIYNYAPKFQGYKNETYEITKVTEVATGKYISKITLNLSSDSSILLDVFILEKKHNIYKIVDISGEGISFAATQRAEFNSMIGTYGLEEFLVILAKKVASLKQNYYAMR